MLFRFGRSRSVASSRDTGSGSSILGLIETCDQGAASAMADLTIRYRTRETPDADPIDDA